MKFAQCHLDCLSQASYLIGDETTGPAVVVDPRRDIDEYVKDAEAHGLTIELVIGTHFHADFDIGNPGEFALGTICGATPIPLGQLPGRLDELDPKPPTVVFCAAGYRSSVGASVLRQAGFADVSLGGYGAWLELIPASA